MKLAITGKREVTSKKTGENYVILSGVASSGKTVEAFFSVSQLAGVNVSVPTKEVLAGLFKTLPVLDVEFNEQGRVESVSE